MPRTTVASIRMRRAQADAEVSSRSISGSVAKMEKTATMISAALVTDPGAGRDPADHRVLR